MQRNANNTILLSEIIQKNIYQMEKDGFDADKWLERQQFIFLNEKKVKINSVQFFYFSYSDNTLMWCLTSMPVLLNYNQNGIVSRWK